MPTYLKIILCFFLTSGVALAQVSSVPTGPEQTVVPPAPQSPTQTETTSPPATPPTAPSSSSPSSPTEAPVPIKEKAPPAQSNQNENLESKQSKTKDPADVFTPAPPTQPSWLGNFAHKLLEGREALMDFVPENLVTITETGTSIGLLAGFGQMLPLDISLSDLYLKLMQFLGSLFGLFGIRKRKPWGTVYDSVTKRPLDPAVVTAFQGGKEVQDAITDLDGRYALLLPAASYTLQVGKSNYAFPSTKMVGKINDLFYNNLYFGGEIETREGDLITRDIPMDPVAFDWNEFAKNKIGLYNSFLRRELLRTIVFKIIFLFGVSCSLVSAYFNPTAYNYLILGAYVIIYGLQKFVALRHRPSMLTDHKTGEPLSFAIVHLYGAKTHVEHKRVIADEVGRFFMLVSPGTYYLVIDIRQPAGWYHSIKQTGTIYLPHGILPSKVRVHGIDITFGQEA